MSVQPPSTRFHVQGLTLLEMLLALALLAGGVLVGFATVKAAGAVSVRGHLVARQNEQQRVTASLLRRQLQKAQPVAFAVDPDSGRGLSFVGGRDYLRFVAIAPVYLGGGAQVHEWRITRSEAGALLSLSLRPLQEGAKGHPSTPAAEVVAWPLRSARFRYRRIDPGQGVAGAWLEQWPEPDRLPHLVALDVVGPEGKSWSPIWIAPVRGGAVAGANQ